MPDKLVFVDHELLPLHLKMRFGFACNSKPKTPIKRQGSIIGFQDLKSNGNGAVRRFIHQLLQDLGADAFSLKRGQQLNFCNPDVIRQYNSTQTSCRLFIDMNHGMRRRVPRLQEKIVL